MPPVERAKGSFYAKADSFEEWQLQRQVESGGLSSMPVVAGEDVALSLFFPAGSKNLANVVRKLTETLGQPVHTVRQEDSAVAEQEKVE